METSNSNNSKKSVLVINGSIRARSTNALLIHAIQELGKDLFIMNLFNGLDHLPHFNSDLDQESPPAPVTRWRDQLKSADGILICTPEYAMGVPGVLKNAIDWTVSSAEFWHKPTALITASSHGLKGHASLLETLKIIEANMTEDTQLVISFVQAKVKEGGITDEPTLDAVKKIIIALYNLMV
jgi:NAD(P)H-dependent FMN reductase